MIDLLLPTTDLNATPSEVVNYKPGPSDTPYPPSGYSIQDTRETDPSLDRDVKDFTRDPDLAEAWIVRLPSPNPSHFSNFAFSSHQNASPSLCKQPETLYGSPEMLMIRFNQQTCGILSVKDGPTENPWRTMIWPLAKDSPALYHAIISMAAFHTSKDKPGLKVKGMEHMRASIRYLANGIENMQTDVALATTLVLAFAESWDQHISTGIEHLRGARILVNQALTKHRQHPLNSESLARMKFLCNTWVYMDVIARLTSIDDDDSNCCDTIMTPQYGPFAHHHEVDPLMGCASTLFPLIGLVANLVRKVRTSSTNSINIISQANELKAAVENWEAPLTFKAPEDPSSEIQHSLQTAESYRWATLLFLHQAVPEIPSRSPADLANKVLVYLATVPLSSRAVIIQIYPLLAAGCEATSKEDRTWVKERWAAMTQRMLIGNLDKCWEVVKEVWDRRDEDNADQIQRGHCDIAAMMRPDYTSLTPGRAKKGSQPEGDAVTCCERSEWCARDATSGNIEVQLLPRKKSVDTLEDLDFERTVRGRLHWVGVMKEWGWESMR